MRGWTPRQPRCDAGSTAGQAAAGASAVTSTREGSMAQPACFGDSQRACAKEKGGSPCGPALTHELGCPVEHGHRWARPGVLAKALRLGTHMAEPGPQERCRGQGTGSAGDGAVWGCGSQHRGELCPPPMGSRRWGPPHRPGRLCHSWTALGQEEEALATAALSESLSTHHLPHTAPVGHVSLLSHQPLAHQSPTAQGKHPDRPLPSAMVPRCQPGGEPPWWALPGPLTSISGTGHGVLLAGTVAVARPAGPVLVPVSPVQPLSVPPRAPQPLSCVIDKKIRGEDGGGHRAVPVVTSPWTRRLRPPQSPSVLALYRLAGLSRDPGRGPPAP